MFHRLKRLLAVCLLAGSLPACATLTTGSTQGVSVMTEPAGASCTLQREGAIIAVVNPTPGTVQVGKSVRDMSVRCTRQGYAAAVSTVPVQFQAMTAGNILIGGLIGIAVDAASGAMGRYPENVVVAMVPENGPGAPAALPVAQQALDLRRNYDERIALHRDSCEPARRAHCAASIRQLELERDAELEKLARQGRASAT